MLRRTTVLLLGLILLAVAMTAVMREIARVGPIGTLAWIGLLGAVLVAAGAMARRAGASGPGAAAFVVAVVATITACSTTTAKVGDTIQGRSDVTARVSFYRDVALVHIEPGPSAFGEAPTAADISTKGLEYRTGDRVWVDTADVTAVLPNPTPEQRRTKALAHAGTGAAVTATCLAVAIMLLGALRRDPFRILSVRVLLALGVLLLIALPMSAFAEAALANAALEARWIGAAAKGASTDLLTPLPALAAFGLAALMRFGVRLREQDELTV